MLPRKTVPLMAGCCHRRARAAAPLGPRLGPGRRRAVAGHLGARAQMPRLPGGTPALWTGLGLSLSEATYLRRSLLSLSGLVLCYLTLKRPMRALAVGRAGVTR